MTIAERIIAIIEERNLAPYRVEMDCGLPHSTIGNWKVKGSTPSTNTITKIAPYLNVSADYLLGLVDIIQPLVLSPEQKEWLDIFNQLDFSNQKKLLFYIKEKHKQ